MSGQVTFEEVVKFEHAERGVYQNLDYNPTFRASSIFFVYVDTQVNTHISFMHYWKEKNKNEAVSILVTLRNSEGKKIYRDFLILNELVYQFDAKKILTGKIAKEVALPFFGSFEIEIHSINDLKYSFPAIEVFYETPDGVSFVHSNQRVFNDLQDEDRNASLNPWQTGFDIFADSGFLTVINGPRNVRQSRVQLEIFNHQNEAMKTNLDLGDLSPYSARLVFIKDVPKIKPFLKNEVGFCKVNFDTAGIFSRIACGNFLDDKSRLSVTHSYYDCSQQPDYLETKHLDRGKEYACFLPFNLVKDIELDLIFYPIYSPSRLSFSLDCYSAKGSLAEQIRDFAVFQSPGNEMLRLDVRNLLEKHNIPASERLYCLYLDESTGKVAARITFGMNYRKGKLGSNVSSSVLMNASHGIRKRLYLWGPLMLRNGGSNYILLSHLSKVKHFQEISEISLKLYSREGVLCEKVFVTKNGTSLNINVEELLAASNFSPGHNVVLWYVLESACANYVCNEIHLDSSGFGGADHSF